MYRKPGSPGVLEGVLSGPYAGGPKHLDAAKLPRAARQRLADVLTGRAEPTPILHEHPGGLASRFRATWGVVAAMVGLATITALGFADPHAAWAYQPTATSGVYVAGTMLLAVSLLSLYRRRALASGGALIPGRYLLPLDVVEVAEENAAGEQIIVVIPLGDGRDARIREASGGRRPLVRGGSAGSSELVLVLENAAEIVFPLRNEREAEHALRRLEHSQSLLEELTYGRELEKALANDPFFDIRVDASWPSLAPSGPASGALRRRRAFLHGSLAMAGAVLMGGALGWAAFVGRSWASDRALYLHALRVGTTEAFDAYLVRGTSYREEAMMLRERLVTQRAGLVRQAAQSRARSRTGLEPTPRAEWELTPEEAATRQGTSEACLASVRARASTAHPEVLPIMEALILRARKRGDPTVPVRIESQIGMRPIGVPMSDHTERASRTVRAFERIFSETCPANVLKFTQRPVAPTSAMRDPGLDLKIIVSWPQSATWRAPALVVHAPTIAFEVALHGVTGSATDVASFLLTLPPPEAPPTSVRPRSLFVVAGASGTGGLGDGGSTLDASVYPLLTARAFDRLYDELYGLFFRGDPRVPLRDDDEAPPP